METENVIKAKHTKKRDPFSIIRWVILAVCVCVMGVSGYKLLDKYNTYRENKAIYDDIAKRALAPSSYNVPGNEQEGESTDPLPMRLANPIPEVDFAALQEISKDAFGWMYLPDTVIDYPIAMTNNNDYYLDHALNGKYNGAGCLFVDYRNKADLSDYNTMIYGHHMRNHTMFGPLDDYSKQEHLDTHPIIYLTTAEGKFKLHVFSTYNTKATSDAYLRNFNTPESFMKWVEQRRELSEVKSDVEIGPDDKIMTLSTCAYVYDNARRVVHCKIEKCPGNTWYEDEYKYYQ